MADQLTALDASFLAQEREGAHLHLGACFVLEGPAPDQDEVLAHVASRLPRIPRYRQRLAWPAFGLGKPSWVDDPSFRLGYHVRRTALPHPGGEDELRGLVGRVFSQRLDRDKPLWELWVVEGLEDGRFAVLVKSHHCMVDGVSGIDITAALFDFAPDVAPAEDLVPWSAGRPPGGVSLAASTLLGAARAPLGAARSAVAAAGAPDVAARRVLAAAEGVQDIGRVLLSGDPRSPINGPIGPHREVAWTVVPLADLRTIKATAGATVNDVVLAIVAGALRAWLGGGTADDLRLRACVPVSLRTDDERGALGNRIAGMFCALPVDEPDPLARVHAVRTAMRGLKDGKQAVGADVLAGLQEFAPPTIHARASRLQFSSRLYNVLVSNVPGPQQPVYLGGRRVLQLTPVAFLAQDKRIAFVIVSYDGGVCFSVIGDSDHVADLDGLAAAVTRTAAETLARCAAQRAARDS